MHLPTVTVKAHDSRTSIIRTILRMQKSQKTVQFSTKSSNKWNACVIFRLVGFIISQNSGQKRHIAGAILSTSHALDQPKNIVYSQLAINRVFYGLFIYLNKFSYLNTFKIKLPPRCLDNLGPTVLSRKKCPPENFYPRTKIFSDCAKNFCPTLKIFLSTWPGHV